MNEKLIERNLIKAVESSGGLAIKMFCPFFTGMPDRLVLMPGGKLWFVELKSTNKKQSKRQVYVSGLLQKLGFSVWVIDNRLELNQFLHEVHS